MGHSDAISSSSFVFEDSSGTGSTNVILDLQKDQFKLCLVIFTCRKRCTFRQIEKNGLECTEDELQSSGVPLKNNKKQYIINYYSLYVKSFSQLNIFHKDS